MLVTDLNQMEKIVDSRSDLSWSGWDVVRHFGKSSFLDKNASFHNGVWVKKSVYALSEHGWNIPDSLGDVDAKLEK